MSVYGILNEAIKVTKESATKVLKSIGSDIERKYNSQCTKIGIHKEQCEYYTEDVNDDNGNPVTRVVCLFSTYHDPDNDWEHSFEYYDSGNSDLSKKEVDKIISEYNKLIKMIKRMVATNIETLSRWYNISYKVDDYRGDRIYIYINLENESSETIKSIQEKIVNTFKSLIPSKFKAKFNKDTSSYIRVSGNYISATKYSLNIDKNIAESNKSELAESVKKIIENINKIYKENNTEFDNNKLSVTLEIEDYRSVDEIKYIQIIMYIFINKHSYNSNIYKSVKLPNYCLDAFVGEKIKEKAKPYKDEFFKLLDQKIKEKFNITNNSEKNYESQQTLNDKKYFYIVYYFSQKRYNENGLPILNYIAKSRSQENVKELKSIIDECIESVSAKNKNIKIVQKWNYGGSLNYVLGFDIKFGFEYKGMM